MESQRYPDDFDGIVGGAPAYNWPGIGAGFLQTQQKIYPDPANLSSPVITNANRALLQKEILAACDQLDGVEDRLVDDPRRCKFDPASLPRCANEQGGDDCVTEAQLAAIQEIYEGPIVDGKRVHAGFPFGGENDFGGWDMWITGRANALGPGQPNLHMAFGTNMFKYIIYDDPKLGLLQVPVRELRSGHRARGRDPQRDRRRPHQVPGLQREAHPVERLVRFRHQRSEPSGTTNGWRPRTRRKSTTTRVCSCCPECCTAPAAPGPTRSTG